MDFRSFPFDRQQCDLKLYLGIILFVVYDTQDKNSMSLHSIFIFYFSAAMNDTDTTLKWEEIIEDVSDLEAIDVPDWKVKVVTQENGKFMSYM